MVTLNIFLPPMTLMQQLLLVKLFDLQTKTLTDMCTNSCEGRNSDKDSMYVVEDDTVKAVTMP